MIKVKIKGNLNEEFEKELKKLVEGEMLKILAELKAATPVDTGEARDGWRKSGTSIVNNVEHIEFLNKGTSQQAPSHFIEKTILAHKGVKPKGSIIR